jgi:hypothetical protein
MSNGAASSSPAMTARADSGLKTLNPPRAQAHSMATGEALPTMPRVRPRSHVAKSPAGEHLAHG